MAKIVKKLALTVTPSQTVQLPASADNLRVDRVGNNICLWADAELTEAPVARTILFIGPGGLLPSGSITFLGTVFAAGTNAEWHVYEDL